MYCRVGLKSGREGRLSGFQKLGNALRAEITDSRQKAATKFRKWDKRNGILDTVTRARVSSNPFQDRDFRIKAPEKATVRKARRSQPAKDSQSHLIFR